MRVGDAAREAREWFETARRATGDTSTGPREDGEEYGRLKDGAPEWVRDLVYSAHGDMLPDDWRYACIRAAVEHIAEEDEFEYEPSEFADSAVDVYTGSRTTWLASHLSRPGYCDDAVAEFGVDTSHDGFSIVDVIALGQYQEATEVYALVARALEDRCKETGDDHKAVCRDCDCEWDPDDEKDEDDA